MGFAPVVTGPRHPRDEARTGQYARPPQPVHRRQSRVRFPRAHSRQEYGSPGFLTVLDRASATTSPYSSTCFHDWCMAPCAADVPVKLGAFVRHTRKRGTSTAYLAFRDATDLLLRD